MPAIETPTDEQIAIANFAKSGKGNLVIDALAGTGKSTGIRMMLEVLPQRSALVCAFNKRIADEFAASLPPMPPTHAIHVKTFHAQGLAMLKAYYPRIAISSDATEELINRTAGQSIGFQMRRSAVRLLRTLKETTCTPRAPSAAVVLALGHEYDLFGKLEDRAIDLTVEVVRDAYLVSLDFGNRESIDFCDMVWAPLALNLAPKTRYHAIFVDELQDISEPQLAMVRKLMTPAGRFLAVGDVQQQIYQFRGSMGARAWSVAVDEMKAKRLPLTTTWRCAKSIVEQARALVPKLRARPDAPVGNVQECTWANLPNALMVDTACVDLGLRSSEINTFVLSRNNAHILDCALFLWREKVNFQLNAGSELLEPLNALLDRLDTSGVAAFKTSLTAWRAAELAKAEKLNATAWADRVEEQTMMLMVALTYAAPNQLKGLLHSIIQPNKSGVLLSTVHKVKGLEAERVFLLKQTFTRHDDRACLTCGGDGRAPVRGFMSADKCHSCGGTGKFVGDIDPAELNIEYVAITRAKSRLIWVDIRHRTVMDRRVIPAEMREAIDEVP